MDVNYIRELVRHKSGTEPKLRDDGTLALLADIATNADVNQYLRLCLPERKYIASGVTVLPLDDIQGSMGEDTSPGTYIRPFGYLIICRSIGANTVCLHNESGKVFWAGHESFSWEWITYKDRNSGEWKSLREHTPENVQRAMVPLADNIEAFLIALLKDELTAQLRALD